MTVKEVLQIIGKETPVFIGYNEESQPLRRDALSVLAFGDFVVSQILPAADNGLIMWIKEELQPVRVYR